LLALGQLIRLQQWQGRGQNLPLLNLFSSSFDIHSSGAKIFLLRVYHAAIKVGFAIRLVFLRAVEKHKI
jgi:hypothetical protein